MHGLHQYILYQCRLRNVSIKVLMYGVSISISWYQWMVYQYEYILHQNMSCNEISCNWHLSLSVLFVHSANVRFTGVFPILTYRMVYQFTGLVTCTSSCYSNLSFTKVSCTWPGSSWRLSFSPGATEKCAHQVAPTETQHNLFISLFN